MSGERSKSRLSRRTLIAAGGALAAAGAGAYALSRGLAGGAAPAVSYSFVDDARCVLTATMTEGPFYIDEALVRRDIREDRTGRALVLRLKIVDAAGCAALDGAAVDIWHCDAFGVYSAAPALGRDERTAAGHLRPVGGARFLRGRQHADANGFVTFTTIYPGWYSGRTPHIHLKVMLRGRAAATTQLFFPDALSQETFASGVYAARGQADTGNARDGVLRWADGAPGAWPKIARTQDGALDASLTIGVRAG